MSFKDEVNFCIKFLQTLDSASTTSSIYSPISILSNMAMVYCGADGNTATEIASILGNGKDQEEVIDYFSAFDKRHLKITKEEEDVEPPKKRANLSEINDDDAVKVCVANQIFVDKNTQLLNAFHKTVKEKFGNHVQKLDFFNNKIDSVELINKYISDATNQRIKSAMQAKDVDDGTTFIIVNAIYFNAKWMKNFANRWQTTFYSDPPRQMDFMDNILKINHTKGSTWECIGIPYRGNTTWMYIVLPKEQDGLKALIEEMDYSMFMECTKTELIQRRIIIPIFEISGECNLTETFPRLGIKDLFDGSRCNLSKILGKSDLPQSNLIKAVHKAVIKVDKYGTEATGVSTCCRIPGSGHRYSFRADHPFIYFIVSHEKSVSTNEIASPPTEILFAGTFC